MEHNTEFIHTVPTHALSLTSTHLELQQWPGWSKYRICRVMLSLAFCTVSDIILTMSSTQKRAIAGDDTMLSRFRFTLVQAIFYCIIIFSQFLFFCLYLFFQRYDFNEDSVSIQDTCQRTHTCKHVLNYTLTHAPTHTHTPTHPHTQGLWVTEQTAGKFLMSTKTAMVSQSWSQQCARLAGKVFLGLKYRHNSLCLCGRVCLLTLLVETFSI